MAVVEKLPEAPSLKPAPPPQEQPDGPSREQCQVAYETYVVRTHAHAPQSSCETIMQAATKPETQEAFMAQCLAGYNFAKEGIYHPPHSEHLIRNHRLSDEEIKRIKPDYSLKNPPVSKSCILGELYVAPRPYYIDTPPASSKDLWGR